MAAFNCVLLMKDVGRGLPFQLTTAPGTKLAPFTVRVKAALPAAVEDGLRLATEGTGLGCGEIGRAHV